MQTLDPLAHIRGNPGMYLRGGRVDADYLATRVASDALLLGAGRVEVSHGERWWRIGADRDWIDEGPDAGADVFHSIISFPEAGVNSMRAEVLLSAIADEVITTAGASRQCVKGAVHDPDRIWIDLAAMDWRRVIAFRLPDGAAASPPRLRSVAASGAAFPQ